MATNFLPTREAELVTWSTNFNALIVATPLAYALTAPQAAAYTALHDAFVDAYNTANSDSTRTPSAIIAKDLAKDALIADARLLARIVQAAPAVSDEQKSDLGLTVRDSGPSPIPPPDEAPEIDVLSVSGNTVRIRLHQAASTRRGKPDGVDGATVFSFVGAAAPTTEDAWKFEGNTTRTTLDIAFPDTVAPGAKVWFTAFWFNERKESGPAATAVGTNLPGGGAMAA
jgi:hypothetical protein